MKTQLKNFIFNGLTYGIIFSVLGFIGSYYTFNLPFKNAVLNSLPIGILAFVANGLLQSRFTKSSKALNAITISLEDSESLNFAAPANHTIDDHLYSGKLFLTEKRLIFKSFKHKEYSWPLTDLNYFNFHKSIFNAGGDLIIETVSQSKLVFEVDEIRKWRKAITTS